LVFFDLDGFRKFNDTFGHLRGDGILKDVAKLVLGIVRANVDTCFRYGGDELSIIMPETAPENASVVAERIRTQVSEHFEGKITASMGIAEWTEGLDAHALIEEGGQGDVQGQDPRPQLRLPRAGRHDRARSVIRPGIPY